jgi:hypothetical protein
MEEDPATDSATANDFVAATMDEDPGTNEDDNDAEEQAHPTHSSCRVTEDHLVLNFEMHKDLAEQQHNQHTLNKCLDILYDSLSSEREKIRCPTRCQPFVFRLRKDERPGSPHV